MLARDEGEAVRRVLSEAADVPHFFDLSDAERLNLMIALAYRLGKEKARRCRDDSARSREANRN